MLQFPTRGGQSADTYSMLSQYLPELLNQARGGPDAFQNIEKPAQTFFEQQLAPGIAQRYAGSGIGSSSGMQNSLASAAQGLTEKLAARRSELMNQSMQNVLSLGNLLLARPDIGTGFMQKPGKGGFFNSMFGIGLPALGAGVGGYFGGPVGAELGLGLGTAAGQAFLH